MTKKTAENLLAINGGTPVTGQTVPYHRPSFSQAEIAGATRVIESAQVAGPGIYCKKVENFLKDSWSVPGIFTTTSCTHALEVALQTLDLQSGDEVIVPAFTYVSTALAVVQAGGRPVFADIDSDTLTLTPETIQPALGRRTRGVIMVHYGGFPGPVERLFKYCEERDIFLIEDAAQAFGSSATGRPTGTFGRFGVFSFHGTKSISCGEGGALVVNNPADLKPVMMIRDKGTDRTLSCRGDNDRYTWRSRGSSYVLSDILGAVLWEQLKRWPGLKRRRLAVQARLVARLKELDESSLFGFVRPPDGVETNGHITAFLLDSVSGRDWLLDALQAEGIEAREHYHPLHLTPYARENLSPPETLPVAEKIAATIVRVPCYPALENSEIDRIVEAFEKLYPVFERVFR